MNIKEKLLDLKTYYETTRQVGHTTKMINGAKSGKCLVLTHNMQMEKHIKNMCKNKEMIIVSLKSRNFIRGFNLPLLIDNAAMYELICDTLKELDKIQ